MKPIGGISQPAPPAGSTESVNTDNEVIGLSGGRYAVLFDVGVPRNDGTAKLTTAIYVRVFDASGDPVSGDIQLTRGFPAAVGVLVQTAEGFAATYVQGETSKSFIAFFDEAGGSIRAPVEIGSTLVAALPSGNFANARWEGNTLITQLLASDGTPIGPAHIGAQSSPSAQIALPEIETLSDGSFIVAWQSTVNGNTVGPYRLRAQHFAADGSPLGADFLLAPIGPTTRPVAQEMVDIAALPDGRFVATWTTNDAVAVQTDNGDIRAQIFNADGSPAGAAFVVASTSITETEPSVDASADGRFVVSWTQLSPIVVKARAYGPDGSPLGGVITTDSTEFVPHRYSAVAGLSDGTFQIVWGPYRSQERFTLDDSYQRTIIEGTVFTDTLIGDAGNNLFRPKGGDRNNLDVPFQQPVRDVIDGGAGIDTVDYATSAAAIQVNLRTGVGSGGDAAYARITGVENIIASAFDDVLIGDDAANRLEGGAGNDRIATGKGGDTIVGGAGSDTVVYTDSNGTVLVNLTLQQGFANYADSDVYSSVENAVGSFYDDLLIGDGAVNRLDGEAGNDVLIGGKGGDILVGGAGLDTASYSDSEGTVLVNLTTGRGYANSAEGDTYSGIEMVLGSVGDDLLIGDDTPYNRLEGAGGNDTLIGSLGEVDELIGGDGIDTVSYEDNQGGVFVNLDTGRGFGNSAQGDIYQSIENVRGGIYADFIIGTTGANRLEGGGGDDTLIGSLGADMLVGGDGVDTASYEENWGGVFINMLSGRGYGNAAEGDTLSDIENLTGSIFADTFIGNDGANWMRGGFGNDTLTGNGDADTFVFDTALNAQSNVDHITDFTPGTDKIVLENAIFFGISEGAFGPNTLILGTQATGGQNRIVYDQATGNLWFDDDGNGTDPAILFAVLDNKPPLTASDFVVI